RDGKDYKTDKGRKLSFMRGIFISCWINHKKRKKLEGTLFGHPHYCVFKTVISDCNTQTYA
nr:hypothetical protein [Bacteroides fragilis]